MELHREQWGPGLDFLREAILREDRLIVQRVVVFVYVVAVQAKAESYSDPDGV